MIKYSNVDGGAAPNLQQLLDDMVAVKAKRDITLNNLKIQRPKVEKLNADYLAAESSETACQLARDAKNTGSAKNKACDINTLKSHSNNKANYYAEYIKEKNRLQGYEADLVKHEAELQTATGAYNAASGLNVSTKPSDPTLNTVLNNTSGLPTSIKSNKKPLLYAGIGVGVILVTFVVIKVLKK
jgi:hypothetical protein